MTADPPRPPAEMCHRLHHPCDNAIAMGMWTPTTPHVAPEDFAWASNCVGVWCWPWNKGATRVRLLDPRRPRQRDIDNPVSMSLGGFRDSEGRNMYHFVVEWRDEMFDEPMIGGARWYQGDRAPVQFLHPTDSGFPRLLLGLDPIPGSSLVVLNRESRQWVNTTADDIMNDIVSGGLPSMPDVISITPEWSNETEESVNYLDRIREMYARVVGGGSFRTDLGPFLRGAGRAALRGHQDTALHGSWDTVPEPVNGFDQPTFKPGTPGWRPEGVDDWFSVWTELREVAARLGVALAGDPDGHTLDHDVELPVHTDPDKPMFERFTLRATRDRDPLEPRRVVTRVTGKMLHSVGALVQLGVLWSSDPFEPVGSGGQAARRVALPTLEEGTVVGMPRFRNFVIISGV